MDALLGSGDSVEILARSDRSCLLMLNLDGDRRRYSLHPLVREALLRRLRDRGSAREAALRVIEALEAAAFRLCLSPATVRAHVRSLYRKLGARKLVEALRRVEELGIRLDP